MPQAAPEHIDDRLRKVERSGFEVEDLFRFDATGDQEHAHVADNLGAWSYLDDVSKELIDAGIGPGDLRPAVAKPHGVGLFLEVGELPSGHLVNVNLGGAGPGRGIERSVELQHFLPVIRHGVESVWIEARISFEPLEGCNYRVEVGLTGGA